jgi:hypothetical protein
MYKIGDKVVIKNKIECGVYEVGVNFVEDMKEYLGMKMEIAVILFQGSKFKGYRLKDNAWTWTDKMLSPYITKEYLLKKLELAEIKLKHYV